jgi:hypothetical protein
VRACCNLVGRSRLPTWSARNGPLAFVDIAFFRSPCLKLALRFRWLTTRRLASQRLRRLDHVLDFGAQQRVVTRRMAAEAA